ncbi:MAG: L-lactate permease, partial [Opitutales bacterium]
ARAVADAAGETWPLFSSFVGGFGAFVAGSNTISNMTFSAFQYDVALEIGANPTWVLALQAVGGAAGNVICVHNVVAASAVVGLVGREWAVIRKTLVVFAGYALLAGAVGYAIIWKDLHGWLNVGSVLAFALLVAAVAVVARGGRRTP